MKFIFTVCGVQLTLSLQHRAIKTPVHSMMWEENLMVYSIKVQSMPCDIWCVCHVNIQDTSYCRVQKITGLKHQYLWLPYISANTYTKHKSLMALEGVE